jgi:hypothetical protein
MSEQTTPTPETNPLRFVCGDIIRLKPEMQDPLPLLVIKVRPDSVDALDIIDEDAGSYGRPGTIFTAWINGVIGHKTVDDTIEIAARAITFEDEVTDVWRARVREVILQGIAEQPE